MREVQGKLQFSCCQWIKHIFENQRTGGVIGIQRNNAIIGRNGIG